MKILAVNPGHNGSVAYLVDGELKFYIEEERLSRQKYDGNPFRGILEAIQGGGVDVVAIGGTVSSLPQLFWTGEDPYYALVRKYNPDAKVIDFTKDHHSAHAATAFYNSGFETAAAIVVDGSGSLVEFNLDQEGNQPFAAYETESIIQCSYPAEFETVFKSLSNNTGTIPGHITNNKFYIHDSVTITKAYEAVSHYLGFGFIEAGKTMGLAPYGENNDELPNLFINGRGDKNTFIPSYPAGAIIDHNNFDSIRLTSDQRSWHHDPSLVTKSAKDLAWKIQKETQELVGDLVEKAHDITGETNIVISGGYGLNCMANYYLQKRFPNLNIYFEPVSHDGGTSIGLAKLIHHKETEDSTIRPQKTLYHGVYIPDYSILDQIESDDNIDIRDVTKSDIAELISEKNIVAMYQGRSEAGPRALGNRSILYDPRDENGKDHVNTVKGREWFRPFAGTILADHFDEWFETYGLTESPFMMHAMDFKADKQGDLPAITHVDGTCRIQTVTQEQNHHFYELIQEFRDLTGVPVLFNTSFNLGGEPLVETISDAISTCLRSDIKYMYLPEVGKLLVFNKNED